MSIVLYRVLGIVLNQCREAPTYPSERYPWKQQNAELSVSSHQYSTGRHQKSEVTALKKLDKSGLN